jgi:tetratricopeptide (TPR) repeat protein
MLYNRRLSEIKMNRFALAIFLAVSVSPAGAAETPSLSPAELRIEAVHNALQNEPSRYQSYDELAEAFVRRARETGDKSYYEQAHQAIENSLKLKPDNFEAEQARVDLLLSEHKFGDALEEAQALNHRMPDAILVWGYMAESHAALGEYQKAEQAAQWMMDLRPGNIPAYLTGATLREDWGDIDGAEEFFSKALQQTPPFETEETAWILTRIGRLLRRSGRTEDAAAQLQKALKAFPDYYLSLEELAEVRMAEHRYADAVELLEKRNRTFPTPLSQLLAAQAYERSDRPADAAQMYAKFEQDARTQAGLSDNYNVDLIAYYVEHAHQPREALRIARLEMENRHDVWTLDAYAWALYANGQYAEARLQIQKALAVGTRDAVLYYHAGAIDRALGKKEEARLYLRKSLEFNPTSEVSEAARRAAVESSGSDT